MKTLGAVALTCACVLSLTGTGLSGSRGEDPLTIRITSPLGRTGLPGAIRIVAQVSNHADRQLQPVRFYVDNVMVGEDPTGPPFAVEWTDENPFESRKIRVEVADTAGNSASDTITLEPFEIVETTEVLSVLLEVTVQDKQHRYVPAMSSADFILTEDDVRQQLDLVTPETAPATFALLIDSSQSMARRIDLVRAAAMRLTRYLRPTDRVLVAPFSKTVNVLTGPTNDRVTIADAISAIEAGGGTAILDSLAHAAKLLATQEGRREIVLITDGYDEHSTVPSEASLELLKGSHATVYVIGIGGVAGISLRGERVLRKIAAETGGRAFFPSTYEELPAVHDMIAQDVNARYVMTYTSTNQRIDGTWRHIKLATMDPSYIARTRSGYFAPKPPPVRPSLEFTVTAADRSFYEVHAEDLMVLEDGVQQKVDTFQEAVNPVSIVLALDQSGSMKPVATGVADAARAFVSAVRPEDRLAFLLFSDTVSFSHDLGTDRRPIGDAIGAYQPSGGTALFDAVSVAIGRLRRAEGRKAIVVVTDGRDENNAGTAPGSTWTLPQVLEDLRTVDATIFAIGLGAKVDRATLERLAAGSGGEALFAADTTALEEEYRRVVENLRRRYVISYTSTNGKRDGSWRNVEIKSHRPEVTIVSRGGYFAPQR